MTYLYERCNVYPCRNTSTIIPAKYRGHAVFSPLPGGSFIVHLSQFDPQLELQIAKDFLDDALGGVIRHIAFGIGECQ